MEPLFTREFLLELLVGIDTNTNPYAGVRRPMSKEMADVVAGALLHKLNTKAAEARALGGEKE